MQSLIYIVYNIYINTFSGIWGKICTGQRYSTLTIHAGNILTHPVYSTWQCMYFIQRSLQHGTCIICTTIYFITVISTFIEIIAYFRLWYTFTIATVEHIRIHAKYYIVSLQNSYIIAKIYYTHTTSLFITVITTIIHTITFIRHRHTLVIVALEE